MEVNWRRLPKCGYYFFVAAACWLVHRKTPKGRLSNDPVQKRPGIDKFASFSLRRRFERPGIIIHGSINIIDSPQYYLIQNTRTVKRNSEEEKGFGLVL